VIWIEKIRREPAFVRNITTGSHLHMLARLGKCCLRLQVRKLLRFHPIAVEMIDLFPSAGRLSEPVRVRRVCKFGLGTKQILQEPR